MADRYSASMKIGGTLKFEDLEEFMTAFRNQGVYNDAESKHSSDAQFHDLMRFSDGDGALSVHDHEAAEGELSELKDVCIKLGLSYNHHNDAYYDVDATNEYLRDGKKIGDFYSTQNRDSNLIEDRELQTFIEDLEKSELDLDKFAIIYLLKKLAGLNIPPLPNFEVDEG